MRDKTSHTTKTGREGGGATHGPAVSQRGYGMYETPLVAIQYGGVSRDDATKPELIDRCMLYV